MDAALQVLVGGGITGVEYALAAVGMTLAFGVTGVLNLALGAFFALGAYIAYQSTGFGLTYVAGAAPAAAAGILIGALVERLLVRPLRADPAAAAIALLGLALLAEQGFSLLWGPGTYSVALRLPTFLLHSVVLNEEQVMAVAAAGVALAGTGLYLRTRWGLGLRGTAGGAEIAQLTGIDVGRLRTIVFGVACGMAAAAGAFLSPLLTIAPTMGRAPLVLSLAMVAAGGPGRVAGTIVAAVVIGLAATIVGFLTAPPWSYLLGLALAAAFVIWRADGALRRVQP